MSIDRDREAELWGQWPTSRGDLAVLYQPVVKSIAKTMERHLARVATTCYDDLVSMGQVGLLNALDRFDRTGPVRFTSFCGQRIRGAMLDEIRKLDHVPRRERERAKKAGETLPTLLIQAEVPDQGVELEPHEEEFRKDPDRFMRYLDHSLRRVARAVIIDGQSVREAAGAMGRPERVVAELYERLKRRLLDVFVASDVTIWGQSRN